MKCYGYRAGFFRGFPSQKGPYNSTMGVHVKSSLFYVGWKSNQPISNRHWTPRASNRPTAIWKCQIPPCLPKRTKGPKSKEIEQRDWVRRGRAKEEEEETEEREGKKLILFFGSLPTPSFLSSSSFYHTNIESLWECFSLIPNFLLSFISQFKPLIVKVLRSKWIKRNRFLNWDCWIAQTIQL